MQGELFLSSHFTIELQQGSDKLREVWSCMSDFKCLGRRMQPRKIWKKALWLVTPKHQNVNRQNVLPTSYYSASVIKLSNTSYFKQLK